MKSVITILFLMVAVVALSGCCFNPCSNQCNPCNPAQVAPVYQTPCCPAPGGGIG